MLHTLVAQNIDGLHQLAGTSPSRLIEIHGTMRQVVCLDCGELAPMERVAERIRAGEDDPPCRSCGGILKSATIERRLRRRNRFLGGGIGGGRRGPLQR